MIVLQHRHSPLSSFHCTIYYNASLIIPYFLLVVLHFPNMHDSNSGSFQSKMIVFTFVSITLSRNAATVKHSPQESSVSAQAGVKV